MINRQLDVNARLGLHARAAAKLVRLVSGFQSNVKLRRLDSGAGAIRSAVSREAVDARSILSVLMLAATCGTRLEATTEGVDEEAAMNAIVDLFAKGFGEMESGSAHD